MRVFLSKEYRDAFGRLVANEMENCRIRKLEL
jgi:hypothetical protein